MRSPSRAAAAASVIFIASLVMALRPAPIGAQETVARPDFTGVWFPRGFSRRTPNPLPFTPGARALADEFNAQFTKFDDPGRYCIWPGMPRVIWGAPFAIEIFHRDQDVTIYWEGYGMYRKIYMADHNPPEPILPTAMGHSVGHWEGDTLVVETTHLRPYPYMDDLPTTSDARLIERYRLEERQEDGETYTHLVADVTLTDPKIYTEPVKIVGEIRRRPDLYVLEYSCSVTLWEEYLEERGLTPPDVDALPEP
jgi:hypothetical protein